MKVLFFVLLVGYAVRCDDNNYYVIQMLDDPPPRSSKAFRVYWNVPTMQCQSKKIPFNNLFEKFGIIQNQDDKFQGDKVTILYDPGLFPALLKNQTSGKFKFRNGGVPQEGDLDKHLVEFQKDLDLFVPDSGFDGIGIIDFESWRPVYRQNFGALQPYKDVSVEIERRRHWWWQTSWLQAEAKQRFEDAARTFMQSTLSLARQLRPNALWGFYGFPYCFNMASNNMNESCASNVPQENDNISWLWQESTALYPSVYSSVDLSTAQLTALIRGRVREASRFASRVLPYFWYRYRDAGFLSETDLNAALSTLYKSKASGFIIWGSSSDVNTVDKCNKLLNYIENVMGPAIAKYTQSRSLDTDDNNDTTTNSIVSIASDDVNASDINVVTTNNPSSPTKSIHPDPEYHWVPPENYTQNIKDHVAEEISKKINHYNETNNSVFSNSVLINLILNYVNKSDNNEDKISNIDSTTTIEGEMSGELESSTTTKVTRALAAEITSVTRAVTNENKINILDLITSTESIASLESTTNDATYKDKSQIYNTLDRETTDYTTQISSDTSTSVTDGTEREKNMKKSYIQDSMEGFFDITETTLNSETIELKSERNTAVSNDLTTKFDHDSKYVTEEMVTTEKNTKNNVFTAINTTGSVSHPRQFTTPTTNIPSTTVVNINEKPSTKAPVFKNNETLEDLEESENSYNSSTKSPDILDATKATTETQDTTSLMSTSSPDQVVVYV